MGEGVWVQEDGFTHDGQKRMSHLAGDMDSEEEAAIPSQRTVFLGREKGKYRDPE